jgi:uncharacterized membrane protein required for colicin V production
MSISGALGVAFGIMTFIFIYFTLDSYLKRNNQPEWRKSLLIGVSVCALTQLSPLVMVTGLYSMVASNELLNMFGLSPRNMIFITVYNATIIDGILLSVIVASVTLLSRFGLTLNKKFGNNE